MQDALKAVSKSAGELHTHTRTHTRTHTHAHTHTHTHTRDGGTGGGQCKGETLHTISYQRRKGNTAY